MQSGGVHDALRSRRGDPLSCIESDEGLMMMRSEIGSAGGLVRRGGSFRWVLAVAVGCVLAAVLWTARPASAHSRQWTVENHSWAPLTLVSVEPWEGNPMRFEGHPTVGSVLHAAFERPWSTHGSPKVQHFELGYGGNVQAVLKYHIDYQSDYVEYWIKNALDFSDARCRFIKGHTAGEWRVHSTLYTGDGPQSPVFYCRAGHTLLSRTVGFADEIHGWR